MIICKLRSLTLAICLASPGVVSAQESQTYSILEKKSFGPQVSNISYSFSTPLGEYCPPLGLTTLPPEVNSLSDSLAPNCWKEDNSIKNSLTMNHYVELKKDLDLCYCSQRSVNSAISAVMNPVYFTKPKSELEKYKDDIKLIALTIARKKEEKAFQAFVIAGYKGDAAKTFARPYFSGVSKDELLAEAKTIAKENLPKNIMFSASDEKNLSEELNKLNLTTKLYNPENSEEAGQCISGREFLAMRQIPDAEMGRQFNAIDLTKLKTEEWSYDSLRRKFSELMNRPLAEKKNNKAEILELKNRIRFLDKNPLVKTFLNASDIGDNAKWKAKLLSDLKAVTGKGEAVEVEAYHETLRSFFSQPAVTNIMKVEKAKPVKVDLTGLRMSSQFVPKKIKTKEALYNHFVRSTGKKSPDLCIKGDLDLVSCVDIFKSYCEELKKVMPGLNPDEGEGYLHDDLDELAQNDTEPDIKRNPELQVFNKLACKGFENFKSSKKGTLKPGESLRNKFFSEKSKFSDPDVQRQMNLVRQLTKKKIATVSPTEMASSSGSVGNNFEGYEALRNEWGVKEVSSSSLNSFASTSTSMDQFNGVENTGLKNSDAPAEQVMNSFDQYSNQTGLAGANATSENKIEHMSDENRRELLDDWKKDYSEMQDRKVAENSTSPSPEESAMKARIEALEQLLAQQKKLSDDQYKLLNQSLASSNKSKRETSDVEDGSDGPDNTKSKRERDSSHEPSRSFASIPDAAPVSRSASPGFNSSSSSSSSSGSKGSVSNAAKSASMANEALLAKYRNNADGSITIESVGNSANQNANAITLSVSDEQYKILQSDPVGLNLSQLEAKIPKDQIARLEKNGQIIIFLKNGNNPMYEVKVQKKDNKLVYQVKDDKGKDQMPVRRVTLKALAGELRANQ